jgi:hypothetical protein
MPEVELPAHGWAPRPAQLPVWRYLEHGGKRAILHAHRRFGKDDLALHWTACAAHQRIGTYWHMLPEGEQVRKAIWEAVNPYTGRRRIDDAFPKELRDTTRENEMFIRFKSGSTWQALGSDNYRSLVGTPPIGLVFSEWSKAHPGAWAYLAPILVENGGWMIAITTPEGRNHSYAMHQMAQADPLWFSQIITVRDNIRMCEAAGVTPPITLESVEAQRREYHALFGEAAGDALIEQEYFCSFSAAILGAYWGRELSELEQAGRLCALDRIEGLPVHTAWDIGVDDAMAVWVFQHGPGFTHILDYVEASGYGFDFFTNWLRERDYVPRRARNGDIHGNDYVPHDAKQRMPTARGARTRIQELIELKRNPVLVPDHKLMDRVTAGRQLLKRAWFDAERCDVGLTALRAYQAEWDAINRVFRKTPKHNWASHGSDAFGYLAIAIGISDVPKPAEADKQPAGALTVNDLLKLQARDR